MEMPKLNLGPQRLVKFLIRIIYQNPHFPYPEYNFARFTIALAYILWGIIVLLPGGTLERYPLFTLVGDDIFWGSLSVVFGLFLFWRIAELKAPTMFCSWINCFVAASWWFFVILLVLARGFIPIGITGNIIVALLATYVYVTTKEHEGGP